MLFRSGLVHTELLGAKAIGNVNLAVVYGIGLILLAMVMGLVYNFFCTRMEDNMNRRAKQ